MKFCTRTDGNLVKYCAIIKVFQLLDFILQVDPFHTLFGIAGLSLLGESGLKKINPVFCMPQHVIDRLQIKVQTLSL